MGGVKRFAYPKYVWSPAGGWWCHPRNWKRNTAIAASIIGVMATGIFFISQSLERRPVPPPKYPERLFRTEE